MATEIGLAVAGGAIAAYGFASDQDVWKGLGVASIAAPFVLIDSVNNARAAAYAHALARFQPTVAAVPGGLAVSLRGNF